MANSEYHIENAKEASSTVEGGTLEAVVYIGVLADTTIIR